MSDPKPPRDGLPTARERPLNADGKGSSGFLLDWYASEPRGVVVKPQRQVLAEFFTSMLVLSAQFKYKPAPGVKNYLYLVDGEWSLSLIAPSEWSDKRRSGFVGTCVLQRDMTWTIEPAERVRTDEAFGAAIGRFFDAFVDLLDTDQSLEDILPFFAGRMPYYQRLYASAMSRSVRATVLIGGQSNLRARDWQALLPSLGGSDLLRLQARRDTQDS